MRTASASAAARPSSHARTTTSAGCPAISRASAANHSWAASAGQAPEASASRTGCRFAVAAARTNGPASPGTVIRRAAGRFAIRSRTVSRAGPGGAAGTQVAAGPPGST
ncbi:hypothetical protein [Amycolatopsis australiensis]|uniref:hypothetical protein n=1 Tax=Amycolatopsis australiensis TaxID=546364 RepID=UPI0009300892|nr:hypothetical protein [Amycolatopsis australiensis]